MCVCIYIYIKEAKLVDQEDPIIQNFMLNTEM